MAPARTGRRIVDVMTEHLAYKLGAFALAVALWVAASGEEPASRYVTVRFAPVLDSGMRMVGRPPRVRALVEGPAGELLKLYATPPTVRHAYPGTHDTTLLVDLHPTDVDLPSGVPRLRVRDVQPRALELRLTPTGALALHAPLPRAAPPAAVAVPNDTPSTVRVDTARPLP